MFPVSIKHGLRTTDYGLRTGDRAKSLQPRSQGLLRFQDGGWETPSCKRSRPWERGWNRWIETLLVYLAKAHLSHNDRAEKRLGMRAVDSFWRVFNRSFPPWTTLFLRVFSGRLPLSTRWKLTNLENNPIQQEVSNFPNTSCVESFRARKQIFQKLYTL